MKKDFFEQRNWYRAKPLDKASLLFIENKIGKKLPVSFVKLMKHFNAGVPEIGEFSIPDTQIVSGIGEFLDMDQNHCKFLYYFENQSEFFPKKVIAFAETGGGDYICFDYRKNPNDPDPPIVYWFHEEAGTGNEIYDVAPNFEAFIDMLYTDDDIDQK